MYRNCRWRVRKRFGKCWLSVARWHVIVTTINNQCSFPSAIKGRYFNSNLSYPPSPTSSSCMKRYGRKEKTNPISQYFHHKQQYQEKKMHLQQHQLKTDHISMFFQAMEENFRTIPPYLQVQTKAKISAMVLEMELEAIKHRESQRTVNQANL